MAKKKPMDKLSWENAQALAAHMSYGKWKAKQAPVKIEKVEEIPEGWSKCECCGRIFKPTIKRPQKYCDTVCRSKAYSPKRKEINAENYQRRKAEANGKT